MSRSFVCNATCWLEPVNELHLILTEKQVSFNLSQISYKIRANSCNNHKHKKKFKKFFNTKNISRYCWRQTIKLLEKCSNDYHCRAYYCIVNKTTKKNCSWNKRYGFCWSIEHHKKRVIIFQKMFCYNIQKNRLKWRNCILLLYINLNRPSSGVVVPTEMENGATINR